LRSFQKRLPDFDSRRIRIVAISVDAPGVSQHLRETAGYSFLFLSDSNLQAIRVWDLMHPHAGEGGADIARPAEFLLDSDRRVRWRNLAGDILVRTRPDEVLKVADAVNHPGN
jgi:peroxiredoxin